MRSFAVFDIDGTVYREAMSFIVAEALLERYDFPAQAAQVAAARHTYKSRGSTEAYWTYNSTILAVLATILPQVTPAQLQDTIEELLHTRGDYCYAYPLRLIRRCRDEGRALIAISGSIGDIVEPFARALGFEHVVASKLEVMDGRFTGKRATQTKQGKDVLLHELIEANGLTLQDSLAVGDTHRDSSMLGMVARAIAFNPNAALYGEAVKHGRDIVLERKNMIYELRQDKAAYALQAAYPLYDEPHAEAQR